MNADDASFFDTVISVVARYGMKRATMADLARATGVSRQTLYDRFGDKDAVMAAGIDHMARGIAHDLRTAFATRSDLAGKLDAYFDIAVWPIYQKMQIMPDAADFESGMGPASVAASRKTSVLKQEVLAGMLRDHLPSASNPPEAVAAFVEQSCSRAKLSDITPEELDKFLSVLRASIVALARTG